MTSEGNSEVEPTTGERRTREEPERSPAPAGEPEKEAAQPQEGEVRPDSWPPVS